MPRRGERKSRPRPTAAAKPPTPLGRIAVRELVYVYRHQRRVHRIDPADFRCSLLAGQLADAWLDYHHKAGLTSSSAYVSAIRSFLQFVDTHLPAVGLDPGEARLDGGPIDLTEVIYQWEEDLLPRFKPTSNRPNVLAGALLILVHHRAVRDAKVPERLRRRAEGPPTFKGGSTEPLDEFANHERLALRDAAQADIRALEKRLSVGRALLEEGQDPRIGGWRSLPNLVWAARHGALDMPALQEHFPAHIKWWPAPLKALLSDPLYMARFPGKYGVMTTVGGLLFPHELDLQPFRVLLLLAMGDATSEEVHDLALGDLEFSDEGVRVLQTKLRAQRVRPHLHHNDGPRESDRPLAEGEMPGESAYPGTGNWDVPGLLRRLIAVNTMTREAFETEPWLFTAVESTDYRRRMQAGRAMFRMSGRRFTDWISTHPDLEGEPMKISLPHDIRRLRKTSKTTRVAALGGSLSDLAGDDHHIEVFRGHYAHGTTAHVLAGRAVNRAQRVVFNKIKPGKPVLVTEDAEALLTEPEAAAEMGISVDQGAALQQGELDMGVVNCRDPRNSPHTPKGKLCHVAPAMCMICPNAVVFTSQLPRLLMLDDHIAHMRKVLPPPVWKATWGVQAAALKEVFAECAEQLPEARRQIEEGKFRLDLPLGMRTEYDR
ncbi:hypothetical protein [Streptomyces abikoensis]|uniref:hypothetical protein n=1 Tax=Streptomyces abikoensis TaxID=97398 RepID=UPI00167AADB3|nr:hypothetical protein [Streptomyces abikoensis]GGP72271.1 hypothetical protein GCM10010214_53940 [Streptomyces abikoensis]